MFTIPVVPPAIFNERISTCKSCKWFKPETGSCGTLIIGESVQPEKVSHYRNKIKLCGCVMKWKAKYRFSSCPAGKWLPYNVDKAEIQKISEFVLSLEGKSTLTSDENKKLFRYFNKVSGQNQPVSTCPPCVKSVLTDMIKEVKRMQKVGGGA